MKRIRKGLKVKDLMEFLTNCNPEDEILVGESLLNLDEPKKTQEFVDWENSYKGVTIEKYDKKVCIGFAKWE